MSWVWPPETSRATKGNAGGSSDSSGDTLLQTYTLSSPGTSVPLAVDETALATSWNVVIPGSPRDREPWDELAKLLH